MTRVDEILDAVRTLSHKEYVSLREAMDELDQAEWEVERGQASREWAASGLTDDDVDNLVMRMRHEGRP